MPIILAVLQAIACVICWIFVVKLHKHYQRAEDAAADAEHFLEQIKKNHGAAVAIPETLPKTFPDGTRIKPLRELPPHLQALIAREERQRGLPPLPEDE
jgi:hypothetical protein